MNSPIQVPASEERQRMAAIRKVGDDLFFVDWGNVHFATTLQGMRDLVNSMDSFIWRELYPSKEAPRESN
jgi:hypothetical protein